MARRRRKRSVEWLIDQLDEQLKTFGQYRHEATLREKVLQLAEIHQSVKDLGVAVVAEHGWTANAARERIRLYLIEYVGEIISGIELAVVSGISDYPRRVRELRREQGYQIASGASLDEDTGVTLKPDQYLLVSAAPDRDAARRWHVANRIRRSKSGSRQRVLQYLMENVGQVVTTEELAYVAKNTKEFARRVRELRTEQGYRIATRFVGRPDLDIGQYVLESKERTAEPHDRRIPESAQKAIYARDDNKCRLCGWNINRWSSDDPRILELHHLEHHQYGGANEAENLIVLCSKCHDEVHGGRHSEALENLANLI